MSFELHTGDCIAVMRTLPASSVDSIVTDPPYGLDFMGKKWDHGVPGVEFWREALRVAKPGAHLLAFGGSRMFHRLACAIEDAGWQLRDTVPYVHAGVTLEPVADCPWLLAWVYGSGFPKSRNLDGDREGWGTALKPAWEPIIMARKPLIGTVASNVLAHGTGALNIDGCRVGIRENPRITDAKQTSNTFGAIDSPGGKLLPDARWPANLIHDGSEEVLAAFPRAPGQQGRARSDGTPQNNVIYGALKHGTKLPEPRGDSGSAARFFYCAKASRKDRNAGLEGMPERPLHWSSGAQSPGTFQSEGTHKAAQNNHPTVKPTELMRYLCRLVTPPDGLVLDPFMGSGSTGRGALLEGFRFVGIEQDADYTAIAQHRIQAIALRKAA
jgi:site-specific DNA-methyltransferase (adenine-specific)